MISRAFTEAELRVLRAADQVEESTDGMTPEERNRYHSTMSRLRRLEREGDAYRQQRLEQVRAAGRRRRASIDGPRG